MIRCRTKKIILPLLFSLLNAWVAICEGRTLTNSPYNQEMHGNNKKARPSSTRYVTGAFTKSAVYNATLNFYQINDNGERLNNTAVATTQSNSNGQFSINIPPDSGTLLIEASGGTFIDESDQEPNINLKRKVNMPAGDHFVAILPTDVATVAITISSAAIYLKSLYEVANGNFETAFKRNRQIAQDAYGFDIISTIPENPVNPNTSAAQSKRQYAMVLGGLANVLNSYSIGMGYPSLHADAIAILIEDLSDGTVDGRLYGALITTDAGSTLPASIAASVSVNNAIRRFRNNNYRYYSNTNYNGINQSILSRHSSTENITPTVNAGEDQTVNESSEVILNGIASDDGNIASYSWTQTGGTTVILNNADTESVSFITPDVETETPLSFQLTVMDNDGTTATDDLVVTVTPVFDNLPPISNAGPDQTVDEGTLVTLSGSGVDTDGSIVSYEWTQIDGPEISFTNAAEASTTFTAPAVDESTTLTLQLSVTDDSEAIASDSIVITVMPVLITNIPPIASAGDDQLAESATTVTLSGSGSDSDGTITAYNWVQISGTDVTINTADQAGASFTAPIVDVDTVLEFQLTVTDNMGDTGTDIIAITIIPPGSDNSLPTVNAGEDQSTHSEMPVTLTGTAEDSDGTIVSHNWTQIEGPAVEVSNADQLTTSFTAPLVETETVVKFELTVIDDMGGTVTDAVAVFVFPVDSSLPVANAGEDQIVDAGTEVLLLGTATDSDGTVVSMNWSQISGPEVSLSATDIPSVTFTAPQVETETILEFEFSAVDDLSNMASDIVVITVMPASLSADAGVDQFAESTTEVILEGISTASDGTIASINWTQISGPTVTLTDADLSTASFTAPIVEFDTDLEFSFTVTDNNGNIASDTVIITVVPKALVADPGEDFMVEAETEVILNGIATTSPDAHIISVNWQQISGPIVELSAADIETISFMAPLVEEPTELQFEFTATDDLGNTTTATITITVVPFILLAEAGDDQFVEKETQVMLTGSGMSLEGTIESYGWIQTLGPAVTLTGADTSSPTFTAPFVEDGAVLELAFELLITDSLGKEAVDHVLITVLPHGTLMVYAGDDQTVLEETQVVLAGEGEDIDGIIVSYQWLQKSGPNVNINDPTAKLTGFDSPAVTAQVELVFEFTVTDDEGNTATDDVIITVVPFTSTSDTEIDAGHDMVTGASLMTTLTGVIHFDPTNLTLTYQWSQIAGPNVSLTSPDQPFTDFTAPDVSTETVLEFRLIVSTSDGQVFVDDVTITVVPLVLISDINFNDSNLHNCINTLANSIGFTYTYEMYFMQCSNASITDLSGLEEFSALEHANLEFNQITDISLLSQLKHLHRLNLANNNISNIDPLSNLTELEDLSLLENNVSDLSPLSLMDSLITLDLGFNNITDITPLSTIFSLQILMLDGNDLTNIDSLANLFSLTSLLLDHNPNLDCTSATNVSGSLFFAAVSLPPHCNGNSNQDNGVIAWAFNAGAAINSSPALDPEGNVYFGADNSRIYSISGTYGLQNWSFITDGPVKSSPSITSSDKVLFGSTNGTFYTTDFNGNLIWDQQNTSSVYASPAVTGRGTVTIAAGTHLIDINLSGFEEWSVTPSFGELTAAALDTDGTAFVGSTDGNLYGISSTGGITLQFAAGSSIQSSPSIDNRGVIYFGTSSGQVYAVERDPNDSSGLRMVWSYQTNSSVYATPIIGVFGNILVGSVDGNMYSLDPNTGVMAWSFTTGSPIFATAAVAGDGSIIFGSSNGGVYSLLSDGTMKWEIFTGGPVYTSPVIAGNGRIYIGSDDGKLYAIDDNNGGLGFTPWPMYRLEPGHSANLLFHNF